METGKSGWLMDDEYRINDIIYPNRWTSSVNPDGKKKKRERKQQEKVKDRFHSLAKAAELSNSLLEKNNSPYRFCVYQKDEEVFIDIVILDKNGNILDLKKKNITSQEFSTWMSKIENGDGLFFDATG